MVGVTFLFGDKKVTKEIVIGAAFMTRSRANRISAQHLNVLSF